MQIKRQEVARTFERIAPVVIDVHIGTETISATPEHPFWVIGAGWTAAGELRRGNALLTKDGVVVHVDNVERRQGQFKVYNFEVSVSHTYYVSSLGVLVHNNCDLPEGSRGSTGRNTPESLTEQLAMEQAKSNPGAGTEVPLKGGMNDPRWPASDGWVKMRQNINGVEVHYVRNVNTGAVDDFKFK
jgi:hypothetical protein